MVESLELPEDPTPEEETPAEDPGLEDTSIPQNEEPSDANIPQDDLDAQPEAEGCSQTGIGLELFHLLGMLWFLRRKISV